MIDALTEARLEPGELWSRVEAAGPKRILYVQADWLRPLLESDLAVENEGQRFLTLRARAVRGEAFYRLRDIVLGGTALLLLSPVFLILAFLVKIGSRGPVFYTTEVVGKDRRPFAWRKFRSMKSVPAHEDTRERIRKFREYAEGRTPPSQEQKVIDHSRVTPVGRFLRRYSLDELPQIWNVLRGQMALVGPRPCLPYEAPFFSAWREKRFTVKPGLTGLWQVYGRGRVSFDEAAAIDVCYIYKRSFWLDARLILKTVKVVVGAKGGI